MAILSVLAFFLLFPCAQNLEPVTLRNFARQYDHSVQAAESLWKKGSYQEALQQLKRARALAEEMEDAKRKIRSLMRIGKLCFATDQMTDSRESYLAAMSAAKDAGLKREAEESRLAMEIWELYTQAQAQLFAGEHEKSVDALNLALELAGEINSSIHEAKCLRQLSLAYLAKQDLENFLSTNQRSLKIAQGLNDQVEKAKSLINIGSYYLRRSDYSQALNLYSEALGASREAQNKRDESLCLKNIGFILTQFGFYERSLDYLLDAHDIDLRLGNDAFFPQTMISLGEGLRNRGLAYSNREDLYRSLDYFAKALNWGITNGDKNTELNAINNIGNIYLKLEKYHTAQSYFRRAQELAEEVQDEEARIQVMNNVGICNLKNDNVQEAQWYFQAALKQGKQIGQDKVLWESLFYLGQCYEKMGDMRQALNSYSYSIDAIEHIRGNILTDYYKVRFMQNKFSVYEAMIDLLFSLSQKKPLSDHTEEIFCAVERAKARVFLETLSKEKVDFCGELKSSQKTREKEISGRIAAVIQEIRKPGLSSQRRIELQKTLKQLEEEYLDFISRIEAEAPDVVSAGVPLPVRVSHVQEMLLDEKTSILEYFLGERNSLLFLITKENFHIFPLPPRKEIETSIKAYLKLLSDPPAASEWMGGLAANRLSQDLLFPALKILPESAERLIFIPDGALLYLPFETLTLFPKDPSSREDPLISKFTISYAPSCSSLLVLNERKTKERYARNLLAFGNPLSPSNTASSEKAGISVANILKETYEGQGFDFSSLPQSDREIKEISSFFPKSDRTICRRGKASKGTIKRLPLEDYQIIHFACHGFIDEMIPYRSSLVLSWDEHSGEDGFLQVREIANLRLAAELIILSACETGRGQIGKGEGILGLTRSLFFSGAKSVVSALWKVGDRVAARFMHYYYSYLSQGHDKAQALRLAKLAMLKSRYSHPFYWAPFVLHGEAASRLAFP
jgi:CHAT domain-containing protein